jgi:hypothetical protein
MNGHLVNTSKRCGAIEVKTSTATLVFIATSAVALTAYGGPANRPDLESVKPIAQCSLQAVASAPAAPAMADPLMARYVVPAADDQLVNYMRSARGQWQIPTAVDRNDPWTRLLLLAPKQPLVIDLAVFIDGKPYRAAREAWIDELLEAGKPAAAGDTDPKAETKEVKTDGDNASDNAVPAGGTSTATAASKDEPPQDKAESKEEPAAEEIPTVAAKVRTAPTIRDRLMAHLAAIGPSVSRDEIRWLMAERGSGPQLILLGPGLSWQRAISMPLLAYLDADRDGALSSSEISGMAEQLKRADADANEVLELSEIRRVSGRPPVTPYASGHPLLVPLDDDTDWARLATEITSIYGKSGQPGQAMSAAPPESIKERIRQPAASLTADELRKLANEPADVSLRIDLGTQEGQASGVSVLSIAPELNQVKDAVTATSNVITLDLGADYIEISAAAPAGQDQTAATQVSVGAVVDGDPLMRPIDRDQDGRLTMRERQALADLVRELDRDGDRRVSASETPIPIRLAVTLGPQVDKLLASATPAARISTQRETSAAPPWFVSMDANSDGDLSRQEFLGSAEQFQKLDADGDGLLGIAEALKAEGGK